MAKLYLATNVEKPIRRAPDAYSKYFLTRGVFMCKVIYIFAKSTVFSVGKII